MKADSKSFGKTAESQNAASLDVITSNGKRTIQSVSLGGLT
jgi:hypothetical protein